MRTDLEADVLILLYDVARHMRTHADQMARDHGLTRAQWIILVRLARPVSYTHLTLPTKRIV